MADLLRGLGIVAIIGLALWNYWYFWATNRGDWLWRLMPVIVGLLVLAWAIGLIH